MNNLDNVAGVLQLIGKGSGFLRQLRNNYLPRTTDVFVGRDMIERFHLRPGVEITGVAGKPTGPRAATRAPALADIGQINGLGIDEYIHRPEFNQLTSIDPVERLGLSNGSNNMSMRVMDLIAPIGKGQRGLIVAPPKTGKTTLIEDIARAVADNHPESHLVMLLVDERPEEVTHMKRIVRGEVVASSADQPASEHMHVARMVHERVKRLVECGKDVVMLLDSITRLARAANRETSAGGKTMSGGVDSRALEFPRKFFGAARKAEEGGSLTIIGTALIDTGSQMDEVIFQEFKGTGNLELVLDRKLAERRIFPAIDISKSGTRKEEKLFDSDVLPRITLLRRVLSNKKPIDAMELLLTGLGETRNNPEFLEKLNIT